MGKINPDTIDKLFSNLKDQSIEADFDQINNFEILLENKRFYSFGWRHFNVYYVLILFLQSFLTIGLLLYILNNSTKESFSFIPKDSIPTDTLKAITTGVSEENHSLNDTTTHIISKDITEQKEKNNTNLSSSTLNDATSEAAIISKEKNTYRDTTSPLTKVPPDIKENGDRDTLKPATNAIVPAKRIVYVKKRDTIIQLETTKRIRKK